MADACLKHVDARMEVDLHPSKMGNVLAGVCELLNDMVLSYDEDLEGVVISVGRPTILSHKAEIHIYFPMCRIQISVPMVVFRPYEGAILTGCVTQVGADFVGMLVAGVVNASVPVSHMSKDWIWHPQAREWRSKKNPEHVIAIQSHIRFKVKKVEHTDVFFGIKGSLRDKATGSVAFLGAIPGPGETDKDKAAQKGSKSEHKKHKPSRKDKKDRPPAEVVTPGSTKPSRAQDPTEPEPATTSRGGKGTGKTDKKRDRHAGPAQVEAAAGKGEERREETQPKKKKKSEHANGVEAMANGGPGTSGRTEHDLHKPAGAAGPHQSSLGDAAGQGIGGKSKQNGQQEEHSHGMANGGTGQDSRGEEKKKKKKKENGS